MLKKSIILASLLTCCILVGGCSSKEAESSTKESTDSKVSTELPEKEVVNEEEESADEITLSEDFLESMKTYTSQFTHVKMIQNMESYKIEDDSKGESSVVMGTTLELDFKNQITFIDIVSDSLGTGYTYSFADDHKNGVFLSKVNDNDYILDTSGETSVTLDMNTVTNAWLFVENISNHLLPEEDTKGTLQDNIYTFTLERDAYETDLTGVSYDSLGTSTIILTVEKLSDGGLVPKSVSMTTTFFVGQEEYGVLTDCSFSDFNNNELTMPSYVVNESETQQ